MNASLYGSKPKNSAFHCPPPYPSGSKGQLQAKAIAKRYERLLLMQLEVPMGHMPRSIQQLVDAGRQD